MEYRTHHNMKWSRRPIWPVLITAGLLIGGCGTMQLRSHWGTQEIDSQNTEWHGATAKIEETNALVGFLNDSNYLYLTLSTSDRALQRQVIFRGLTVWFDREGGDEKRFGVHFPLGFAGNPMGFRDRNRERPPADTLGPPMMVDTNEIEILGPMEGEHHRLNVIELKDIAVRVSTAGGNMVYLLRVPLRDNGADPYAIGTIPGNAIGVGFETGEIAARRPASDEGEGGAREGGMGRRGGGMGGYGGGGRRYGGGQPAEPLKTWVQLQLATADTTSTTGK